VNNICCPSACGLKSRAGRPACRAPQSALLLRLARGEQSVAEFARKLGTSWPAAQRLEDPTRNPTLKPLEKAAAVSGKRLVVSLEDIKHR